MRKILTALALFTTLVAFTSCATSKKNGYGCPTVSVESKTFKA